MLDTELLSLRELLFSDVVSNTKLKKSLRSFHCEQDKDVESYLNFTAMNHEKLGISRTYLIVDISEYEKGSTLGVVAYATLTISVTDFSDVSQKTQKDILGSIPKNSSKTQFGGYLLAQLGRDSRYTNQQFDCKKLVAVMESLICQANDLVGGRVVYLDCKDELISHYTRSLDYKFLYRDSKTELNKLYKVL